jgi:hypothetical protein
VPLSRTRSLLALSLSLSIDHLSSLSQVEVKLISGIMSAIHSERSGQAIDSHLLHRIIRLTLTLNIYKNKFEIPFLNESRWYFQQEGQAMMCSLSLDPSEYLAHVEARLTQANQMIIKYLTETTRGPLVTLIEENLLRPHLGNLIKKGSQQMFLQCNAIDLKRLYLMCKRIQMMRLLRDSWMEYLR